MKLKVLVLIGGLALLGACSKMNVEPLSDVQGLLEDQGYQLKVGSDRPELAPAIYQMAFESFSKYLPLKREGPYTGTVEVLFASTLPNSPVWATVGGGSGWYSGGVAVGGENIPTSGASPAAGGPRNYLDGTMVVEVKDLDGKRIWALDYRYRGRWALSSLRLRSPEDVARYCVERLTGSMRKTVVLERPAR
jgi:hypothetical protein